jgi:REP element-mobilizing transposase RayT
MDRGHDRAPIFTDDDDRSAFLDLIARYADRFGFRLYHYGLMTNHVHLLVQLRDPRQLSRLMAGLLRAYVHHCQQQHGFDWRSDWWAGIGITLGPARAMTPGACLIRSYRPIRTIWNYRPRPSGGRSCGESLCWPTNPHEEAFRRGDWAVGDDSFRRRACLKMGRPEPRPRGRPRKSETPQVQFTMQTDGNKGVV